MGGLASAGACAVPSGWSQVNGDTDALTIVPRWLGCEQRTNTSSRSIQVRDLPEVSPGPHEP